jgi:hypothetical protein
MDPFVGPRVDLGVTEGDGMLRWHAAATVFTVNLALLAAATTGAVHLREEEREAAVALAEAQQEYREGLLNLVTDLEKVLEPVLTADAYTGEVGDEIRADVYRFGGVDRDLDHLRSRFDRLDAAAASREDVHRQVGDRLVEMRDAVGALAAPEIEAAGWAEPVGRLKAARDGLQQVLRQRVLDPTEQLPSSASSKLGATRASSVLLYDSACENAVLWAAPFDDPSSPEEAARQLEEVGTQTFLVASAILSVEVPGYEIGHVDTHVRPHAQVLLDRADPLAQELGAAIVAGDLPRAERAFDAFRALDDVGIQLGRALVDYGASVCAVTFGLEDAGQPEDEAATPT